MTRHADAEREQQAEEGAAGREKGAREEREEVASERDGQDQRRRSGSRGEETPLLTGHGKEVASTATTTTRMAAAWWYRLPRDFASAVMQSLRWLLSTLASPGVYLIACFCDDETGGFAPLRPFRIMFGGGGSSKNGREKSRGGPSKTPTSEKTLLPADGAAVGAGGTAAAHSHSHFPLSAAASALSAATSDSDSEMSAVKPRRRRGSSRYSRSPSLNSSEEISPARRSIRIKLQGDEALQQRKHKRAQSATKQQQQQQQRQHNGGSSRSPSPSESVAGTGTRTGTGTATGAAAPGDISAQLKSPTSPMVALTRYPKTPAPPRPLVPRRQPSYVNVEPQDRSHQKTLILDLDETLIHSIAKGGRMTTGHMVEVRLNTTYTAGGGHTAIGPQHPILYWVNKRPHCDDFLRRVYKWYNLVIFTASVPEYADPVIDWLEQERKFFSGRYYRQHCTFRQGAFIKDLSAVEPDLSKVMILDNSPLSYMFHQDNAIPIQGWINDPTDNDLLHLMPLLEGLQYVSDVRALLALRGGEDGKHMA